MTDVSGYAIYTQNITSRREVRDDLMTNIKFHDAFQAYKCVARALYTTISLACVAISVLDADTVHFILQPQE